MCFPILFCSNGAFYTSHPCTSLDYFALRYLPLQVIHTCTYLICSKIQNFTLCVSELKYVTSNNSVKKSLGMTLSVKIYLLSQDHIFKCNCVFELWNIDMNCYSHIMSNIIKWHILISSAHRLAQLMTIQHRINSKCYAASCICKLSSIQMMDVCSPGTFSLLQQNWQYTPTPLGIEAFTFFCRRSLEWFISVDIFLILWIQKPTRLHSGVMQTCTHIFD